MNLIERNGRSFYEGNAKINKFLHLAQNFWLAKTGELLFYDSLYAYDNGAVVLEILDNYAILQKDTTGFPNLKSEIKNFFDRVFYMFAEADVDELIALSHEDDEWVEKSRHYKKHDQIMNSIARADEYKKQYSDALTILYRMDINESA
jgi:uncharacterized phage-associated protein